MPLDDILAVMREHFPGGYRWEAVTAGFSPDGKPFFVGNLSVEFNGVPMTVPGSADLQPGFGVSGAATVAFKNACLRGLGMGEALYKNKPAPVEPSRSYTTTDTRREYDKTRNNSGNSSHNRAWDGKAKVKSGQWAGTDYCDLPDDVIDKWAGNGVTTAVMEQNRRRGSSSSSGPSNAAVETVRRAPWNRR